MQSKLGISRYLSNASAPVFDGRSALAFVSAHVPEERDLQDGLIHLIQKLKENGYQILCDIDSHTPGQFGVRDEKEFMERFGIDLIRLDDGYSFETLKDMAARLPIALNASTLTPDEKTELLEINPDILFVHNFYPKEDTGLDLETFAFFSQGVPSRNLGVFIPGDTELRLPLKEGLVTLEEDRFRPPYCAFVRFQEMGIQNILIADPGISEKQLKWIRMAQEGIYPLPCRLSQDNLYNQPFTIRKDSPKGLKRLQESRSYGKPGETIAPRNCSLPRKPGDICQDNELFGRYSGEITIVNKDLPPRERINTIGAIDPDYVCLLDWIANGSKIQFVPVR